LAKGKKLILKLLKNQSKHFTASFECKNKKKL